MDEKLYQKILDDYIKGVGPVDKLKRQMQTIMPHCANAVAGIAWETQLELNRMKKNKDYHSNKIFFYQNKAFLCFSPIKNIIRETCPLAYKELHKINKRSEDKEYFAIFRVVFAAELGLEAIDLLSMAETDLKNLFRV